MKKFCNSQVSVVTFSGGEGKWFTVCFLLRSMYKYNTVESDLLGFPKVKWLHLDIYVRFSCQLFSEFNVPKIIKID